MIQVTKHTVVVPNLPEALRGLRVAHLTDLHRSDLTPDRLLRHAVARTNEANPDLILLTGDYVTNNPADIEPCAHILAALHAPLGVYAILGNHDNYTDGPEMACSLERVGIEVLLNHSVRIADGLHVVGLEEERFGRPDITQAFREVAPTDAALVLVHNPAYAEQLSSHACILFAGHTHGGQIWVPVLTKRQLLRIGAKHYRAGWYTLGKAKMYVNRGLGKVGMPIRFRCRPEIALFTLTPA